MADPDQTKKPTPDHEATEARLAADPLSDSARAEMAAMLAANPRFTKRQGEPGVTTFQFVSKKQLPKKK